MGVPDFRFDRDTASLVLPGDRDGVGSVTLSRAWNVDGRILNGGYLQAVAVRAVLDHIGTDALPTAVSTSFVAAAQPGPADVAVTTLRRGRRVTAASTTIRQGDVTVLQCLVTVAHDPTIIPAGTAGGAEAGLHMPEVAGPDECYSVRAEDIPGTPGLAHLIDYGFVPAQSAWMRGGGDGRPHIRCWLSFADGRPIDQLAVCALMDMAPPVCFAQGRFGWAPTMHLQVGLFAVPTGGPVLLDVVGAPYEGAVVAEDGTLWDADGTVLARSRQIALAPAR